MKVPILFLIPLVLLSGCGFNSDNSKKSSKAEAAKYIEAGCKAYKLSNKDSKVLINFSKLAILDPSYLEVARAAGLMSLNTRITDKSFSLAETVKPTLLSAFGLLQGFCAKFNQTDE